MYVYVYVCVCVTEGALSRQWLHESLALSSGRQQRKRTTSLWGTYGSDKLLTQNKESAKNTRSIFKSSVALLTSQHQRPSP